MERLGDSELRVMEVLWREGDVPAKRVAGELTEQVGWNKNTTYTLLKRLIGKDMVRRTEPGFMCRALVSREAVQRAQSSEFVDKLFGGSASKLFAALVDGGKLPERELIALKKMIDGMK